MKIKDKINKKEDFNVRLKVAMQKEGISQAELVLKTGIPKSAISQYISGAFLPKKERLTILANALDVSEIWLQGYEVPMRRKQDKVYNYDKNNASCSKAEDPTLLDIYDYLETFSHDELEAELVRLKLLDSSSKISPITRKELPLLSNVASGEPIFDQEEPKLSEANKEELSEDVIIYHRDGKTVRKQFTKEQMDMLLAMINAIPEKPKDI